MIANYGNVFPLSIKKIEIPPLLTSRSKLFSSWGLVTWSDNKLPWNGNKNVAPDLPSKRSLYKSLRQITVRSYHLFLRCFSLCFSPVCSGHNQECGVSCGWRDHDWLMIALYFGNLCLKPFGPCLRTAIWVRSPGCGDVIWPTVMESNHHGDAASTFSPAGLFHLFLPPLFISHLIRRSPSPLHYWTTSKWKGLIFRIGE